MERLNDLPTAGLWNIFQELSKIPHASGNEKAIAGWICSFAEKNGIEAFTDQAGNVILRKKASEGCENSPSVCMQGHMDMVAVKTPESSHDFAKDPLSLKIEEINDIPYVTADGTTLGADDCIGVAAALAVMTDPELRHGPLEALFTVGEEVSMVGMNELAPGLLRSSLMLNLDSENDEEVTVGCAGGEDARFRFPLTQAASRMVRRIEVTLSGLTGGHSGIEIHKNRANAICVLSRILKTAADKYSVSLQEFTGGTFRNAIPVSASAVIYCEPDRCDEIRTLLNDAFTSFSEKYAQTDPGMNLTVELSEQEEELAATDSDTSASILNTICEMPDGVITMSDEFEDRVETSCNLGLIRTENSVINTESLMRSLISTGPVAQTLADIADRHGFKVEFSNKYPCWTPSRNSILLKQYERIYEEFNFKKPDVCVLHAGVECGLLLGKYPDMDVISFGPTIIGAHTVEEKVSVYSVEKFYGMLTQMLEELA